MHRSSTPTRHSLAAAALGVVLVIVAGGAAFHGGTEGAVDVDWATVDCGGGRAEGGGRVVHATIGQHDAAQSLTGGSYEVHAGFWALAPDQVSCLGDIDLDGDVDVDDLTDTILDWGCTGSCPGDADSDGDTDVDDLTTVILNWGPCP